MANPGYVRYADGNDADNGSTWALANQTLTGAMADAAAGDTIYVSDNHSESTAGAVTITSPGTLASPCKIYCVDDAAEPPTALAATAVVATSGANNLNLYGCFTAHGIDFQCGTSDTGNRVLTVAPNTSHGIQRLENCKLTLATSGTGAYIQIGASANYTSLIELIDTEVSFGHASQGLRVLYPVHWNGGGIASGSAAATELIEEFPADGPGGVILLENLNLSGLASTATLADVDTMHPQSYKVIFRNCKLPASWTGTPAQGTFDGPGSSVEMHNCDDGDTNYVLWTQQYEGGVIDKTDIYRDSGAGGSSGLYSSTTEISGISWLLTASANAEYPLLVLKSPEIVQWNDTVGSAITVTVEILQNANVTAGQGAGTGNAFQNDQVWLELEYLGTSGYPLGDTVTTRKALLATAADVASSAATWTGDDTGWLQRKLVTASFTPQERGYIHARVCLAAASKAVYVDPLLTIAAA